MTDHRLPVPSLAAACGKALSPVIRDAWAHTLCSAGNLPLSRAHAMVDAVWAEMATRFAEADLAPVTTNPLEPSIVRSPHH